MADYNTTYTSNYNPPIYNSFNTTKVFGAAVLGGVVGMSAYYIPVQKNGFVNEAFKVAKRNTEADIVSLKNAASEIQNTQLSNDSKILLNRLGVAESYDAIIDKCKLLQDSISESAPVKNLKSTFEAGFETFKKQASTMDNIASEAMQNIKWRSFKWGMIIGSGIGLGLGMLNSKD